jgi:6-pyruvoyltetrahydropterin/6-carboxytetrahydropterin synthase
VGKFRIARRFEIDAGHRLSKHPELCRFPHGHTYRVEVVLCADRLDDHDMVCDTKALKTVVGSELSHLDHAMLLAEGDPAVESLAAFADRVVTFTEGDPTTEILAQHLFRRLRAVFCGGSTVHSETGAAYVIPAGVLVERVRVWETGSTWAEFGEES